jgi:hypothetical protein
MAREAAEMRARWYPTLQAGDSIHLELSVAACRRALLALKRRDPLATRALSAQPGVNVVILRVGPYWQVDLWAEPPSGLVINGGSTTWIIDRATFRIIAGPIVGL